MNIVRIGSSALSFHTKSIKVGKDVDFIMTFKDYQTLLKQFKKEDLVSHYPISNGKKFVIKTIDKIYEIEIAWPDSTAEEFMNLIMESEHANVYRSTNGNIFTPSLNALYVLKMSHRFLRNSPHFLKTMDHIILMRDMGARLDPKFDSWFKKREKETYYYNHPDLTVKKQDFFQDEKYHTVDHVDIHEAIKLSEIPAYKRIIADGYDVKCDQSKFESLSHEHKMMCVVEESYTLALERMMIPNDFAGSPKLAFTIALQKVCTSITSGWFRNFSWEHYHEAFSMYNSDYVDKFKSALDAGKVRPFDHDRSY
jgi:hypothetical protein